MVFALGGNCRSAPQKRRPLGPLRVGGVRENFAPCAVNRNRMCYPLGLFPINRPTRARTMVAILIDRWPRHPHYGPERQRPAPRGVFKRLGRQVPMTSVVVTF